MLLGCWWRFRRVGESWWGCAICSVALLGAVVGCAICSNLFHADEGCCGVNEKVIDCLVSEMSGALQYLCCKGRNSEGGGKVGAAFEMGESFLFDQLFKIVVVLSRRVGEMSSKLQKFSQQRGRAMGDLVEGNVSRELVRIELRELQEQQRRQNSFVLRSFQTNDILLRRMFSNIYSFLGVGIMELSSVVKIGNTGLFRAKILDRGQRMVLMNNVKRVRQSEQYKSMYIQCDLTYRLCQEELFSWVW